MNHCLRVKQSIYTWRSSLETNLNVYTIQILVSARFFKMLVSRITLFLMNLTTCQEISVELLRPGYDHKKTIACNRNKIDVVLGRTYLTCSLRNGNIGCIFFHHPVGGRGARRHALVISLDYHALIVAYRFLMGVRLIAVLMAGGSRTNGGFCINVVSWWCRGCPIGRLRGIV